MLLCSAGDFYGTADAFNEPKSHFVAQMMGRLGYDAIAVGEMDLNYGLSTLIADAHKWKLPLTCANLVGKGARLDSIRAAVDPKSLQARLGTVFPPLLVVERDGVRFGFVGLLSPDTKVRTTGKTHEVSALTYVIRDPVEMARQVIPEAAKRCDVLVLLAHMDQFELKALLPKFPQVDLAVLGHDPRNAPIGQPLSVGNALVLKATTQGQNIGCLEFSVADGKVTDPHNTIINLGKSHPDDPAVVKLLDEFDKKNRKEQKILYAKSQLQGPHGNKESNRYLGVGACQTCHEKEFQVYMGTAHAHAFSTLAAQFVQRDSNCVGCHVTGYGQPGGFDGVRRRGSMVDLVDVQCEACHGPGAEHSRDGSYLARAKNSCTKCHTKNDDPEFNFAKDWPKVAH